MQKFGGWLIKFGDVVLPNSFLLADGWESTPNQRVEIDAYRDANILLHRETSPNFKTKLTLNIREMNLEERRAWNNIIGLAERTGTQIRTADTSDEQHIRIRTDLLCGLFDAGELFLVISNRQVKPTQEVIAETSLGLQLLMG